MVPQRLMNRRRGAISRFLKPCAAP